MSAALLCLLLTLIAFGLIYELNMHVVVDVDLSPLAAVVAVGGVVYAVWLAILAS